MMNTVITDDKQAVSSQDGPQSPSKGTGPGSRWQPTITDRTAETVREFITRMYKHDRLAGRNGDWCPNYSDIVISGAEEYYAQHGFVIVGHYEAVDGQAHFWEPIR